jgi:dolichyl-phosphate beta-glucosyltransferase
MPNIDRASCARTLVIPMYREAPRIARTIHTLAPSFLNHPDTEIILVDDGSDDDTVAVARAALAATSLKASILCLKRNLGKGGAVRAGVLASAGRVIGFSDADLSAGVTEIAKCFAAVESGRAQVVCSSRAMPASVIPVRQPRLRELSGKIFNLVLRLLGLTRFHDTQCGLKVFTREAALRLFEQLSTAGFAFDVEVLLLAEDLGLRVEEVPVEWRHVEESRVRPMRDGLAMLRDILRIRLARGARRRRARPSAARVASAASLATPEGDHERRGMKR